MNVSSNALQVRNVQNKSELQLTTSGTNNHAVEAASMMHLFTAGSDQTQGKTEKGSARACIRNYESTTEKVDTKFEVGRND